MKAILFAVCAALCWGVGEFFTKQVMMSGKIGPFAVIMVRIVAAAPIAIFAYLIAANFSTMEVKDWWLMPGDIRLKLLLGSTLLASFGGVAFFYLGLRFGDISIVIPIAMGLSPVIGAFLGWWFLKEQMPAIKVIGILMMVAGLVLVAAGGRNIQLQNSAETRLDRIVR